MPNYLRQLSKTFDHNLLDRSDIGLGKKFVQLIKIKMFGDLAQVLD